MSNHTHAPWEFVETDDTLKVTGAVGLIAVVGRGDDIDEEYYANAHLISAAPDMCEALAEASAEISRLNEVAGHTVFNPAVTELIRLALTKATWGSSETK